MRRFEKHKSVYLSIIIAIIVTSLVSACNGFDIYTFSRQNENLVFRYLDYKGKPLIDFADFDSSTKEYSRLIDENIAPQAAYVIGIYNLDGRQIGKIGLDKLKHQYGNKLYSFGMMSDVHIGKENSEENLSRTLEFYNNYGVKFIGCLGDIVNYGNHLEALEIYNSYRNKYFNIPFYTCVGNHENNEPSVVSPFGIMTTEAWAEYVGMEEKNMRIDIETENETHHIIVFSCVASDGPYKDRLSAYYVNETLDWLESALSSCGNDKVFVFMHVPFPDKGNWGYDYSTRRILNDFNTTYTDELSRLRTLVAKYKNSVWFMGHTHEPWSKQGLEYTNVENANTIFDRGDILADQLDKGFNYDANISPCNSTDRNEGWCVHIPANYQGEFAVVDVYSDCIVIKGVSNGKYLPIAHYKLDLE